ASTRGTIERDFSDRIIGALDTTIESNRGTFEFWSQYCKLPDLSALDGVSQAIRELRSALLDRLQKKIAAPQEAAPGGPAHEKANCAFETARVTVARYNEAVRAANDVIAAKKAAVASGDVKAEEAKLVRLKAQKKRHEAAVSALCADFRQ